jgi:hypothetical protein
MRLDKHIHLAIKLNYAVQICTYLLHTHIPIPVTLRKLMPLKLILFLSLILTLMLRIISLITIDILIP